MANVIKILIAAIIFWALLDHSQLNLGLFSTVLERPFTTLAVMGLCYVMVILHTWRWYRLNAAQGIKLSFSRTIMPTYLGIGFNTVLPGSVGGDFVRLYFILKKFPAQKSAAILSILVDRINGLMGILIIACLTAPYYLDAYRHNEAMYYVLLVCVGLCIGGALAFLLLVLLLSEKVGFSEKIIRLFSKSRFSGTVASLLEAIHIYRNAKLIIFESLLVSMATQLLLLIVIVMIGDMMGLPALSPFDWMIALVIGQIANLIPLTPGGIGVGEAAFANILILLNPGTTAAYATAFLALRVLSTAAYLPGVIFGIFGFHLLHKDGLSTTVTTATSETV